MRVHVVSDKCQGHSRCYSLAPDVFDVDDLGQAHERHGGEVPAGSEASARLAADNCPEYAIEIED